MKEIYPYQLFLQMSKSHIMKPVEKAFLLQFARRILPYFDKTDSTLL